MNKILKLALLMILATACSVGVKKENNLSFTDVVCDLRIRKI